MSTMTAPCLDPLPKELPREGVQHVLVDFLVPWVPSSRDNSTTGGLSPQVLGRGLSLSREPQLLAKGSLGLGSHLARSGEGNPSFVY